MKPCIRSRPLLGNGTGSILVNSTMKSATTWPFMALRRWYYTSNSLNSITHSAICLVDSGLLIARRIGLSIKTTIAWAWKYGLSLSAVVTKVKASFSIGEYLSSMPRSARLV